MANPVNTIQRDRNLTDTLDVIVSDGTLDDVIESLKSDAVGLEAPATEAYHLACQLVLNAHDDAFKRVCELYFQNCKVWSGDALADLEGYGSGDDLIAGSLGFTVGAPSLYRCVSVDSPTASTWALFGADQDLAGVLTAGNETGGTDIYLTGGSKIYGEDGTGVGTGGDLRIESGVGDTDADPGDVHIYGANAIGTATIVGANTWFIAGAGAGAGAGGQNYVRAGRGGPTGDGGNTFVVSGSGGTTSGDAGKIMLASGTAPGGDLGVVRITNTCLEIAESAATPGVAIGAGSGRYWVGNTSPSTPKFTGDLGAEHTLAYAFAPSEHRVRGSTARGSTNTMIYRWATVVSTTGSDITYTDSATSGGYWQVNTDGVYSVSMSQGAGHTGTIAIKSSNFVSNTYSETTIRVAVSCANGEISSASWIGALVSGSYIWIASDLTINPGSLSANLKNVLVTRIA